MKVTFAALLLVPVFSFASGICSQAKDHMSFNVCAEQHKTKAFARLKVTYNKALERASESGMVDVNGTDAETYLKESQKLWWKFKEFDCNSPVLNFGSSGAGAKAICEAEKAGVREKELRKIYLN